MAVETPINTPGAIEIGGARYLRNSRGDLVAVANIRPMDLLMDEMVRKIIAYGEDLSAELGRFAAHIDADIAAFDALIFQEFGVEPRETKGNRTFSTYDGMLSVSVRVSERIVLGPELQAARAVLDAMIRERGEGADPFIIGLVQRAFRTDQEGKVDFRAILDLRRQQNDDPRWPDFCRAIDAAIRVVGVRRNINLHRKDSPDGKPVLIPLDLANARYNPDAFARRSLRRQVEELEAQLIRVRSTIRNITLAAADEDADGVASWLVAAMADAGGNPDEEYDLVNDLRSTSASTVRRSLRLQVEDLKARIMRAQDAAVLADTATDDDELEVALAEILSALGLRPRVPSSTTTSAAAE
jgi:hypothetical protein